MLAYLGDLAVNGSSIKGQVGEPGLKEEVVAAYKKAERLPKPPVEEMFNEVYGGEMPWNLVRRVVFPPVLMYMERRGEEC